MSLHASHPLLSFFPSRYWTGESRTRRFFFPWQLDGEYDRISRVENEWWRRAREREREVGVESRLAWEQHEAQCWETIWIRSWIPGSGSSGGATKHAPRYLCTALKLSGGTPRQDLCGPTLVTMEMVAGGEDSHTTEKVVAISWLSKRLHLSRTTSRLTNTSRGAPRNISPLAPDSYTTSRERQLNATHFGRTCTTQPGFALRDWLAFPFRSSFDRGG